MSRIIEVHTSHRESYTVTVGRKLLGSFNSFCADRYSPEKLFVVIDEKVYGLHGEYLDRHLNDYFREVEYFRVPEGEPSKSITQWNEIVDWVLQSGTERSTPLVAIGGGVTGDLAGFSASSILRGIPLIHVPTSLLAMVDSSIGGKTGVNHQTGKNLAGSFYQPDAVFADINFLSTLKRKEWINGLAEVIKYASIRKPELFPVLEKLVEQPFEASDKWVELISQCAAVKVNIVEQDTRESGIREYLNFGHTFGHALEKRAGYSSISHGEAVFAGMLAAVYASRELGAEDLDPMRFAPFMPLYDINFNNEAGEVPRLIALMKRDKKVKEGVIRLILLRDWGDPYVDSSNREELIGNAWRYAFDKLT